jgi:hypothetical protein
MKMKASQQASLRSMLRTNPVSPSRLALYSYLIFLVAWVFPPDLYTFCVHEPNFMYLDDELFIFCSLCVLGFMLGICLTNIFGSPAPRKPEVRLASSVFTFCFPVLAFTLWAGVYIAVLGTHIDFLAILTAQQGDLIKLAGASSQLMSGQLDKAVPYLTAALWWSYARFDEQRFSRADRLIYAAVFWLGLGVAALVCVATVDRTRLMPIVIGTAILFMHKQYNAKRLSWKKLVTIGISGALSFVGMFMGFSFLRGSASFASLMASMMGYTVVSYNRTAALIHHLLYPAFQGKGVYLVFYLTETEQLENLFHYRAAWNWPDFSTLFHSEFQAVGTAGLNSSFNWFSTFGYLYTDVGWYAPLMMIVTGVLTCCVWRGFEKGTTLCVILYPWFAFAIFFWIGWNILFSQDFFFLLEAYLVLLVWEKLFFRTGAGLEPLRTRAYRRNETQLFEIA